jgi:hypothetical protein
MSTRLAVTALFLLSALSARAQSHASGDLVAYVELGGALGLSLNLDARSPSNWYFRAGATGLQLFQDVLSDDDDFGIGSDEEPANDLVVTLMGGRLHGSGEHRIETGIGVALGIGAHPYARSDEAAPAVVAAVGYRLQSEGGVVVRMTFSPVWVERRVVPAGGFSLGYSLSAFLD